MHSLLLLISSPPPPAPRPCGRQEGRPGGEGDATAEISRTRQSSRSHAIPERRPLHNFLRTTAAQALRPLRALPSGSPPVRVGRAGAGVPFLHPRPARGAALLPWEARSRHIHIQRHTHTHTHGVVDGLIDRWNVRFFFLFPFPLTYPSLSLALLPPAHGELRPRDDQRLPVSR